MSTLRAPHPLRGPNRFKLGLFSANADGGLTLTTVPERWQGPLMDAFQKLDYVDLP